MSKAYLLIIILISNTNYAFANYDFDNCGEYQLSGYLNCIANDCSITLNKSSRSEKTVVITNPNAMTYFNHNHYINAKFNITKLERQNIYAEILDQKPNRILPNPQLQNQKLLKASECKK